MTCPPKKRRWAALYVVLNRVIKTLIQSGNQIPVRVKLENATINELTSQHAISHPSAVKVLQLADPLLSVADPPRVNNVRELDESQVGSRPVGRRRTH